MLILRVQPDQKRTVMEKLKEKSMDNAKKTKTKTPIKTLILPVIELLIKKYKKHAKPQFKNSLIPNLFNQS